MSLCFTTIKNAIFYGTSQGDNTYFQFKPDYIVILSVIMALIY